MLTPLDDFLVHQTPDTVDRVCTSDRNFYDRYYFNAHTLDGDVFFVLGMGVYPNLGVIDAFATVVIEGRTQHVLKASRELVYDRLHTQVGPIGVQVIEGLRKLRVFAEPNDHGISFDMTFEAIAFPYEEPHFFRRQGTRVYMDYTRLTQGGRWSGTLNVAGRTYDVRPDGWYGARDHSWGVRPIGDREPPSAPPPGGASTGFYWTWSAVQFDDRCMMYTVSEEPDGSRWHAGCEFTYRYGLERKPEALTVVAHDLKMKPGTRAFAGGTLQLARRDGSPLKVTMAPKTTLHMAGAGYAYITGWRHGQYHGPLAVEGDVWDLEDPGTLAKIAGQTETVCDFHVEGEQGISTGHGIFEFLVLGAYEPYGFKTFTDVAQ